jgi:ABC-type glycerol-3-phosphate transport system substrate-binding protein
MSLRGPFGLLLLGVLVVILGACGASTQQQEGNVELTFWHHEYPPADEFIRQKIEEYTEENANVSIELVTYPHGDYETKLLSSIAADNPPDIINLLDYLFPRYAANDLLAPVEPQAFGEEDLDGVRSLYVPRALDGLTINGEIYGVPEEFNTLALFLNAQHFEEIGLDANEPENWPETWEELFALAKELEQRDQSGKLTRIGFNWVWGLDPYWYAQQYWPILRQYGCEVVDSEGRAAINSPECVAAFEETWQRLIEEGIGGPGVATENPVNALEDFSTGRQSMAIAGIWAPPLFDEDVQENYVVAPLPQRDPDDPHTLLNSYALAVSSSSEHPREAWKFINFLTSHSGEYLATAGYVTGRKGWAETPEAEEVPGVEIFQEGQQYGSFVWRSETWTQEGTVIKEAIENFAQGGASVQEALDRAAQEIDRIRSGEGGSEGETG